MMLLHINYESIRSRSSKGCLHKHKQEERRGVSTLSRLFLHAVLLAQEVLGVRSRSKVCKSYPVRAVSIVCNVSNAGELQLSRTGIQNLPAIELIVNRNQSGLLHAVLLAQEVYIAWLCM